MIAANAQGTAGIERTLLSANPELTRRSTGLLPVVLSIEAGEPPEELVSRHRLPELCGWYESVGAEALVLGINTILLPISSVSAQLPALIVLLYLLRTATLY